MSRPDVCEHCRIISLCLMSGRIHTHQQAVHRCIDEHKPFPSNARSQWTHVQPWSLLSADINECEAGEPCPGQQCVNTEGSYSCVSCQQGYHTVNSECAGEHIHSHLFSFSDIIYIYTLDLQNRNPMIS